MYHENKSFSSLSSIRVATVILLILLKLDFTKVMYINFNLKTTDVIIILNNY